MKPFLSMLVALLALVAGASVAHAELLYGHTYSLQNDAGNSWGGGYLDTDGNSCHGGSSNLCVATSTSTTRDGGSGTWLVLSATGKAHGTPVSAGDEVVLQNMWSGSGGYLYDLNGTQCGPRCIFTTTPAAGAGDAGTWWKIEATNSGTQSTLSVGDPIRLRNQNTAQPGTYLSTDSSGCNGDLLCVSASLVASASGASTWRFVETQTSPPAQVGAGWCRSTDQPGYIVKNDTSSLYWDVYGNLTLHNDAASSGLTNGEATSTTWGISSSAPLHGAGAGKLCFYMAGGWLEIQDSTGANVWSSANPTSTTVNDTLSLTDCALSVTGGSPSVTKWTETTPECNKRALTNGTGGSTCWPAPAALNAPAIPILWDNDTGVSLVWDGDLRVLGPSSSGVLWDGAVDTGAAWPNWGNDWLAGHVGMLCLQPDGNLVVYNKSGGVDWAMNSVHSWPATMALDACGLAFEQTGVEFARLNADNQYGGLACSQSKNFPGWCRTTGAAGPLLYSPTNGHLDWNGDGRLVMYDSGGAQRWQSNAATANAELCFQRDGNLVVYNGSSTAIWASSWSNKAPLSPSDVLTFDGTNATVVNEGREAQCSAGSLPTCDASGHCTAPSGAAPSGCSSASYWTVWDSGALAPITYLSGGGFSFIKDLNKGNSDFGAELWIVGATNNYYSLTNLKSTLPAGTHAQSQTLADLPSGSPANDYMEALVDTGISVTLFGSNQIVFSTNGFASYDADGSGQAASSLAVYGPLGFKLYDGGVGSSISAPPLSEDFFSVETTIDVGGIPLTIAASATGEVGFNVGAGCSVSNSAFSLSVTPYAGLSAEVSLMLGPEGVGVGIDASLTLLQLSVPMNASTSWSQRSFNESMSFDVSTLSGEIDIFAELGPLKASKTLASFDGYSTSVQLFSAGGNL